MYLKKFYSICLIAVITISVFGCGQSKSESKSESISSSVVSESEYTYEELSGSYSDSFSQRAELFASAGDDALYLNISWSSSADEVSMWSMSAQFTDNNKLSYSDCAYGTLSFAEDPEGEYKEISVGGTGYFTVSDGKLLWDGAEEDWCQDCVFEKVEFENSEGVYEEEAIPSVYEAYFLEEIDGEYIDTTEYLDLHEDYTGYWISQDSIPITWDSSNIYDESGNSYKYLIRKDDYNADLYTVLLYVDESSDPREFMICYELPEDMICHDLPE